MCKCETILTDVVSRKYTLLLHARGGYLNLAQIYSIQKIKAYEHFAEKLDPSPAKTYSLFPPMARTVNGLRALDRLGQTSSSISTRLTH